MRRLIVAAALCAAWTGQGHAADAAFKLAQIGGEATAFAELCASVKVDRRALALLAVKMGLRESDIPWRNTNYSYQITKKVWGDRSAADACDVADMLYGPNGNMAAGILVSG